MASKPETTPPKWFQDASGTILLIAAAIGVAAGLRHACFGSGTSQEIWGGICCLLSAGVLVLLPNTSKLSLGKDGLVMEQKVKQLEEQLDTAAGALKGLRSTTQQVASASEKIDLRSIHEQLPQEYVRVMAENGVPIGTDIQDPLKTNTYPDQSNGYRLTASVENDPKQKNWFKIRLKVVAHDSAPSGTVKFFLHPTFANPVRTVKLGNSEARLSVWSIGSFTVVSKMDDGTMLELDLATVSGVSNEFKER